MVAVKPSYATAIAHGDSLTTKIIILGDVAQRWGELASFVPGGFAAVEGEGHADHGLTF